MKDKLETGFFFFFSQVHIVELLPLVPSPPSFHSSFETVGNALSLTHTCLLHRIPLGSAAFLEAATGQRDPLQDSAGPSAGSNSCLWFWSRLYIYLLAKL